MTSTEAFDLAKRKSKATHKNWIVWPSDGLQVSSENWVTEPISVGSLCRACEAVGEKGRFSLIQHRQPYYWIIRPGWQVKAFISNLQAGSYAH